ncbi:MAG: methyltransferase [Candidatus Altiarchaeales archaeon]|nr:methyltransferase [Candidatus Altiarchaeota archaeon]MBU4341105.1 methyltransferase [Candidatus Altiarchaeota archaeon]MBU4406445.1 methyltransferase [Candidatus Altiarchaeota archaeon]MBU4437207.1 methyltransferase [Candidatus Altiarchaeota archaeon]MCG2782733.1 methyltransferase [Candidatus Altiarchaeales archaeon]
MEIDNLKLRREVYKPAEDSFLLAENLLVEKGDAVLDLGTGTGILALTAAEKADRVVGTDINPIAVELARENARVNGIGNAEFIQCDLFPPGNERFDLIVFNPPYLPVKEPGLLEKAWSGGEGGIEIIERFLDSVSDYLKDDGVFELLISSLGDMERIDEIMKKNQIEYEIIAKRKLFFEELSVIKGKIFNH